MNDRSGDLRRLFARTDLACEAAGGGLARSYTAGGFEVRELRVRSGEDERRSGRRAGRYVTFFCGQLARLSKRDELASAIAAELAVMTEALTGRAPDGGTEVMAVCLGNRAVTADALGPLTADALTVTRHVRLGDPDVFRMLGCSSVSSLTPGISAQSGLESAEYAAAAAASVKPDIIIAVDALAARSTERLGSTVQLSDNGVSPGSGVGNRRPALTREVLGAPVISLGVPTVTDSSSLVLDALDRAGIGEDELDEPLRRVLENGRSFVVTPGESDLLVSSAAKLLASAIELAFGVPEL